VVVHHADSLHESVADRGPHKPEPAFSQIPAHAIRRLRLRRHIRKTPPCVLNGDSVDVAPEIGRKGSERFPDIQNAPRIPKRRFNLQAVPHNAGIAQKTGNIVLGIPGDTLTVEPMKRPPVMIPFPENREPAQTGLGPFQDKELKKAPVVMNRDTPLLIVVSDIGRVIAAPYTPLFHVLSLPLETGDILQKNVLRGTPWLLLKNPENSDTSKGERERLADALKLNQPLACAYIMKEDLRQTWLQPNKSKAQLVLADWIKRAESSGIKMLMKFAKTLAAFQSGILSFYDYRISSASLEGTNNKIKTMKRMAYGFRDMQFFKLKIMAIHETKYALVG